MRDVGYRQQKPGIRKPNGFTLTEIAIVLGIIGLVLGGIWVAAKTVMDSNRADQAVQDISTMAANMRATFLAVNQFSAGSKTDATAAMVTAGIIPSNLIISSGSPPAKNAWGGEVRIYQSSTDNRHFRISYLHTPPDACFRIASQLANLGTPDAPVALITNGSNSVTINLTGAAVGLTTAKIQTACNLNTSVASASTEFDYAIH
jgi:prepilin-type N-terminal cleavage/methylation domain-containing protein